MAKRKTIYLDDALDILDDLQSGYENGFSVYADSRKRMIDLPSTQPERVWTPCDIQPNHHDEKQKMLAEIMKQEDILRVEHGEKPLYQTEEDFYAEHTEYK